MKSVLRVFHHFRKGGKGRLCRRTDLAQRPNGTRAYLDGTRACNRMLSISQGYDERLDGASRIGADLSKGGGGLHPDIVILVLEGVDEVGNSGFCKSPNGVPRVTPNHRERSECVKTGCFLVARNRIAQGLNRERAGSRKTFGRIRAGIARA